MSRPTKQGVDYFPLDCQFDDKIELLIAEKGGISVSVLITVWQLIYQNEGYYINFSNDLFLLVKRRLMIDEEIIEGVILAAIKRNIFNEILFNKHKILTSKAIQKRYFIAAKKKKNIEIIKELLLIGVSDGGNYTTIGINDGGNATKVKEEVEVKEEVNVKEEKRLMSTHPSDEMTTPAAKSPKLIIPFGKIIDLYHKILPALPRVLKLTNTRKSHIKARWTDGMNTLDDWEKYFTDVSTSKFLTGKKPPTGGRTTPFVADIDFLILEKTIVRTQEGKYHEQLRAIN